ncbi:MAG: hypothetical protein WA160_06715 [Pseudobdellovibrio sp.]
MKNFIIVLLSLNLGACVLVPKLTTVGFCDGVLRDQQKQGMWTCRDPKTNQILMKAEFNHGIKNGRVELFYANGKTESLSHWQNGVFDGEFKSYFANGQQQFDMYYNKGVRSEKFYEWDESGESLDDEL